MKIIKSKSVSGWPGKTYFDIFEVSDMKVIDIRQRMLVPLWWDSTDEVLRVYRDRKLIERGMRMQLDTLNDYFVHYLNEQLWDVR